MKRKLRVATLGSGQGKPGEKMYDLMVQVGRRLAKKNCVVINGAYGGIGMEAPSKGASEASGEVIGYGLEGKRGNKYLTQQVNCSHWDEEINLGFSGYGIRLGALMDADAFIIASGGGIGTLLELVAIFYFQKKVWKEKKKVVLICDKNLLLDSPELRFCHNYLSHTMPSVYSEIDLSIVYNARAAVDYVTE